MSGNCGLSIEISDWKNRFMFVIDLVAMPSVFVKFFDIEINQTSENIIILQPLSTADNNFCGTLIQNSNNWFNKFVTTYEVRKLGLIKELFFSSE